MNKFYSSLIINGKNFPNVHQLFKPRYNKEFFKRITDNVEKLDSQIKRRVKNLDSHYYDLKNLKKDSRRLVHLKERLERIRAEEEEDSQEVLDIKSKLESYEERLMPLVVKIPNRCSKLVPKEEEEVVLDEIKTDFLAKQKLSKVLDHRKLSFINNCYSKSIVGPNSHYYFGIGAKLQLGLDDFFSSELEENRFIMTSGMCLTKSAVVEAANSIDSKNYMLDPCRILTDDPRLTTLHLVEASREALTSFITTIGPRSTNLPLRLMTSGAGYRDGSDWFDGSGDKLVSQFQTLHTLTLTSSIEQYSMREYHETRDIIWKIYKKLELPARLVQCNLDSMLSNEYDASRIDIWLPSRRQWLPVGRVSHYLDYITIRVGMKRGHIIDSSVYNGQSLVAAIIENRQTSRGKFIIPEILQNHLQQLTNEEKSDYFNNKASQPTANNNNNNQCGSATNNQQQPKLLLNNYEQRRYLVKRSYLLGHSEKAKRQNRQIRRKTPQAMFLCTVAVLMFLDWSEIWRSYLPRWLQKVTWDYGYRIPAICWYYFALPKGVKAPYVMKFDEIEARYFAVSRFDIVDEEFAAQNARRKIRKQMEADKASKVDKAD